MELTDLCSLLSSFSETRQHLEAAALSTSDPESQADFEGRAKKVATLMADLRGEILARELPRYRTSVTAEEFEAHLDRVLKSYGLAGDAAGLGVRRNA